jgi:hypothetical protein
VKSKSQPLKVEALLDEGTLNPTPEKVRDPKFRETEFFDPRDIVQVRYEMLRRVSMENASVVRPCCPRPELRVMDRRRGCAGSRAAAGAWRHGLSGEPRFLMLGGRLRVKGGRSRRTESRRRNRVGGAGNPRTPLIPGNAPPRARAGHRSSSSRALLRSLSAFRRRVVARPRGVFGIELDTVQDCLCRYMHPNLSPVLQFIGRVPEEVDGDSDAPKGRPGGP